MTCASLFRQKFAERQNAYWYEHFGQESYYVTGRSYDQYQPAYALGWQAVLRYPKLPFKDLEHELELQWDAHRGQSFLPWREVQEAVKSAWVHACRDMRDSAGHPAAALPSQEVVQVLRPLLRGSASLAQELATMGGDLSMNDFARQVLQRHMGLLEDFAQELSELLAEDAEPTEPVRRWSWPWLVQWGRMRARFPEYSVAEVYARCEQKERGLLSLYDYALLHNLPLDMQGVLSAHQKVLQKNFARLQWVRHNWRLS